jgi:hypothetical protein
LLAETSAVTGIHGNDLDAHSVIGEPTNDGAAAHLTYGHVEKDLHGATERDLFLSANVKTAQREIFHIADIAVSSGLPRNNYTLGRLNAGMLPLLRMLHVQSREEIAGSKQFNGVGEE